MQYQNLEKGIFLERKNRFVANVELNGEVIGVHVPNTGRCKELFVKGTECYVQRAANTARKYPYTLCAVYKGDMLVHIDSAGANRLCEEALKNGRIGGLEAVRNVEREKTFSNSRFDFRFEKDGKICYMEVKGVTLENDGVAMFPDAPTERGARHLEELVKAKEEGYGAYVMFVIQMKGPKSFTPHIERDLQFTRNLVKAQKAGVQVMAYDTLVTVDAITLDSPIDVVLPKEEEI
ncbi:MAG: DNA/RNA nuclease SfsA [Firmicutes bacterium]|nr:DNA/RNA nuclease SfsA [Bacillota bacterium]